MFNVSDKDKEENEHHKHYIHHIHGFFNKLFSDPSKISFYIPMIIGILIILIIVYIIAYFIKKEKYSYISRRNTSLKKIKNLLNLKYLVGFILARSAMWAKAPYLYTLFMTVHKFTIEEIHTLYLVEAVSALIFAPISGFLADKYGRKLFCQLYNISIIINVLLRIQGSHKLAYLSQVITGFGSNLIYTTFEAWVVSESEKEFKQFEKDVLYRQKLFKKSNILESAANIFISGICATLYTAWGIYVPFWISIILSLLSFLAIAEFWEENKPLSQSNQNTSIQIKETLHEITDVKVFCVGLIEGITLSIFNIFLFSWTPILKQSTEGEMRVGLIFVYMILIMILGIKLYEIFIIYCEFDYYMSITACILVQGTLLYITYIDDRFFSRFFYLTVFIGFTGFYNPLNSIVKSNILIDKYRALLMNLYRIPLNIYIIIIILTIRYMNPLNITVIAGSLAFVSFGIGVILNIYNGYKNNI